MGRTATADLHEIVLGSNRLAAFSTTRGVDTNNSFPEKKKKTFREKKTAYSNLAEEGYAAGKEKPPEVLL